MFVRRPIVPGADQRVNGDILGRRSSLLRYE
jgi:hypothetical protein